MPSEQRVVTASSTGNVELLYLIERFLSTGQCIEAAQALREEIDRRKVLPKRRDFLGRSHEQTFAEYAAPLGRVLPDDLLQRICDHLAIRPVNPAPTRSLFDCARYNILQKAVIKNVPSAPSVYSSVCPPVGGRLRGNSLAGHVAHRERTGNHMVSAGCQALAQLSLSYKTLGHLSSVFCVAFDRTGEYVFTGADDNLVKVWLVSSARLVFTFRGSSAEITDLSVSFDNALLAAGSIDRYIRVWCLRSGAAVAVLQGHSALLTTLHFVPFLLGEKRYLVSTSNDCCVCFWSYDALSLQFNTTPIKFHERVSSGAQMICSSCSAGGAFVAAGCTDLRIRLYLVDADVGPSRVATLELHTDRVDSLHWAHGGLRFASGSMDGTAVIWTFERQEWRGLQLRAVDLTQKTAAKDATKAHVTMISWSADDACLITAFSDFLIRLWDTKTGKHLRTLQGHTDETFVLDTHPLFANILLSAGHDGLLIVWNVHDGSQVWREQNETRGLGHGAFFDACYEPNDGASAAAVDSHGHLLLFSVGTHNCGTPAPDEQFFHTDYRPVVRDANGYVLDENTQTAPHLMPPPFLVDADGQPHPSALQRRVPGREHCDEHDLAPTVVVPTAETQPVSVNDDQPPIGNIFYLLNGGGEAAPGSSGSSLPLCVWLRRPIVRPLSALQQKRVGDSLRRLAEAEMEQYELERCRAPLPTAPTELPAEPAETRRRPRRRQPQAADAHSHEYPTRAPRPSAALRDGDFVDPDTVSLQSSSSSSQFDDSSDDSDSDSDYSGVASPAASAADARPSRRRDAQAVLSDADVVDGGQSPSDSAAGSSRLPSVPPTPSRPSRKPCRSSQNRRRPAPTSAGSNPFPDWMLEFRPRRFPYLPQPADKVVYFCQGHDNFLTVLKKLKLYRVDSKMNVRFDLEAEEFAVVVAIRYQRVPHRMCSVRLAQMNKETGELTGRQFTVRFHDMADVADFIILKQHYDAAVARNWRPGDRLQSLIDQKWWFGTVVRREAFDSRRRRSHWLSLVVKWDNGDDERVSPWDMEPMAAAGRAKGSAPADERDAARVGAYEPAGDEWPSGGRDAVCERLFGAVNELLALPAVQPFAAAVDLRHYPSYPDEIDHPIDLSLIGRRLQNRFYRRLEAFVFDVTLMCVNAINYNLIDSVIARQARLLYEALTKFCREEGENIISLYDDLSSTADDVLAMPEFRFPLEASDLKARAASAPLWKKECEKLMAELLADPRAESFVAQDNPEMAAVFDSAVDLSTMATRLHDDYYESPDQLHEDVDSLLKNCRSMATNKRSPIYLNSLQLQGIFRMKVSEVVDKWNRFCEGSTAAEPSRRRLRRRSERRHQYSTRSAQQSDHPRAQLRPELRYWPTAGANSTVDDDDGATPSTSAAAAHADDASFLGRSLYTLNGSLLDANASSPRRQSPTANGAAAAAELSDSAAEEWTRADGGDGDGASSDEGDEGDSYAPTSDESDAPPAATPTPPPRPARKRVARTRSRSDEESAPETCRFTKLRRFATEQPSRRSARRVARSQQSYRENDSSDDENTAAQQPVTNLSSRGRLRRAPQKYN